MWHVYLVLRLEGVRGSVYARSLARTASRGGYVFAADRVRLLPVRSFSRASNHVRKRGGGSAHLALLPLLSVCLSVCSRVVTAKPCDHPAGCPAPNPKYIAFCPATTAAIARCKAGEGRTSSGCDESSIQRVSNEREAKGNGSSNFLDAVMVAEDSRPTGLRPKTAQYPLPPLFRGWGVIVVACLAEQTVNKSRLHTECHGVTGTEGAPRGITWE